MKPKERDIDLIEKRLDGTLSGEELREFERRYEESTEFRDALTFHQSLIGNLEAMKKQELKDEMRVMMAEANADRTISMRPLWIAASLLIVGSFAALQIWKNGSTSEELFQRYFDPYPLVSVVRGDEPAAQASPLQFYAGGNYEKFAQLMENGDLSQLKIKSSELLLAYGNSLLALGRPEDAIRELNKITQGEKYYMDAQWYLALAHLNQENLEKSRELLLQLIEQQSFYQSSARKLLEEIKE